MALARRNRGFDNFTWPGFVDGLASILLVVIFVLMVLFLIQVGLALRVSGQNETLSRLRGDIATLAEQLNLASIRADDAEALRDELTILLEKRDAEIAELKTGIAALETGIAEREAQIAEREAEIAGLRGRITNQTVRAIAAEESARASRAEVLTLTQSLDALRDRLSRLQTLLDEKEREAVAAREAHANLTRRLNEALGSKLVELQSFRSEFFGQLRAILADRDDIRIVGDRFVFDSEVLFAPGSADIDPTGEATLLALSRALAKIAGKIPTDIDWVLQVSGHTDSRPISNARFRDNWDLSAARATSVLRFLVANGMPPERLAAAGWGEFRPVDTGTGEAANARNRRIEFKLTNR